MAKKPTLNDVVNILTAAAAINSNYDKIEAAFNNTLSLDGSTPNAMSADFDMDGNDILNVGTIQATNIAIEGVDFNGSVAAAQAAATAAAASATAAATSESNIASSEAYVQSVEESLPEWKSEWVTATAYAVGDLVRYDGSSYICTIAHTSGTFSTDLSNVRWELFAQKGAAGTGTGDMLAANNLSDVDNTATSLANIGGQPLDANLTSLSSLGTVSGKIAYTTGVGTWAETTLSDHIRVNLLPAADGDAVWTVLGLGTAAAEDLTDNDDLSVDPSNVPTRGNVAAAIAVGTNRMHVQHKVAAGTNSGNYPGAGAWTTRPLTTVITNTISGASLASNLITLPAGTYRVRARSPMFRVNQNTSRLYDTTNSVTLIEGSSTFSNDQCDSNSWIEGEFTLAGTADVAHQAAADSARTVNAYGHSTNYGSYCIYGEVILEKIG